jgi:hypothetical protein
VKKIEYKVISQTFSNQSMMERWLNDQGKEGWDLFSMSTTASMSQYFIFKRESKEKKIKIDKILKTE